MGAKTKKAVLAVITKEEHCLEWKGELRKMALVSHQEE